MSELKKSVLDKELNCLQAGAICVLFLLVLVVYGFSRNDLEERLYTAARDGDTATVKRLVNQGVDVDSKDAELHYLTSPLIAASGQGYTEIVKFLLDHHANTRGALHAAIENHHPDIVRLLKAAEATEY